MSDVIETYPEVVTNLLTELKAIPEQVLGFPILDNGPKEVQDIQSAIHKTIQVLEKYTPIVNTTTNVTTVPTADGTQVIDTLKTETTITIDDLAGKYWDAVSN